MIRRLSSHNLKRQLAFWAVGLVFLIIFLMVFSSILLPFVAGMALAYFLDPVADWFERRGLTRLMATVVILVLFVVFFAIAMIILIPILAGQANQFLKDLPGYITSLQQLVTKARPDMLPSWARDQIGALKDNFSTILGEGTKFLATLFEQIWNSGKAIVDVVSLLVVTPVVAFYLLLDWDRMVAWIDNLVPRDHVHTVRALATEMDSTIAGFVRGQGTLCLVLGIYYGTGLALTGLNFGLLIGLFSGAISFIPYIGSTVGLVLAVGLAIVQFWPDYLWIGLVALIFLSGQFLEGNILQPRLVGHRVGLHPVWLMFALFAFGLLFGFVGLLVAVPVSAAIGVLVRFAISRYLDSDLYYGDQHQLRDLHQAAQISKDRTVE
ncbi:MAG TPA: AI-2E family transporter [Ensifer sp.]|nr:AI-2E family transporter [Ensifer sp.]